VWSSQSQSTFFCRRLNNSQGRQRHGWQWRRVWLCRKLTVGGVSDADGRLILRAQSASETLPTHKCAGFLLSSPAPYSLPSSPAARQSHGPCKLGQNDGTSSEVESALRPRCRRRVRPVPKTPNNEPWPVFSSLFLRSSERMLVSHLFWLTFPRWRGVPRRRSGGPSPLESRPHVPGDECCPVPREL